MPILNLVRCCTHQNSWLSAWPEVLSGIGSRPIPFVILSMAYRIWYAAQHIYLRTIQRSIGNPSQRMTAMNCKPISNDNWQLHFNVDKCKVLHLGRNNKRLVYEIGDIELQSTKVENDLGVYADEKSKFHHHISFAVNKSSTMLWLIKLLL